MSQNGLRTYAWTLSGLFGAPFLNSRVYELHATLNAAYNQFVCYIKRTQSYDIARYNNHRIVNYRTSSSNNNKLDPNSTNTETETKTVVEAEIATANSEQQQQANIPQTVELLVCLSALI